MTSPTIWGKHQSSVSPFSTLAVSLKPGYSLPFRLLLLGGWHTAVVGSCQFFGVPKLCSIFVELRISHGWLPKAPWSNDFRWRFPGTVLGWFPDSVMQSSSIINHIAAEVSGCTISRYSSFLLFRLWPLLVWFATSVGRHAGHVTSFTTSS